MNDRYLYKAKRKDNGEWVKGYYFRLTHPDKRHTHHFIIALGTDLSFGTPIEKIQIEIDINTLCQCIGIDDKNDKLIWENDIVRRKIFGNEVIGVVKRIDVGFTGFMMEVTKEDGVKHFYPVSRGMYDDTSERCNDEVIGNIFDHSEIIRM